jgi:hypothetical protein
MVRGHDSVNCFFSVIDSNLFICEQIDMGNDFIFLSEIYVRTGKFQVFRTVGVKNAALWDVTPCGSSTKRHFGEMYRFHYKGEKISEVGTNLAATGN